LYLDSYSVLLNLSNNFADKKIIIFGASKAGKMILNILAKLYVDADYFVDNNPDKWGTTLMDKKIIPPTILKDEPRERTIILIASTFDAEISSQLNEMSYERNVNFFSTIYDSTPKKIKVGKHTFCPEQLMPTPYSTYIASIGAFCSIAPGVIIGPSNHPLDLLTTHSFTNNKTVGLLPDNLPELKTATKNNGVVIKNDVWIGINAIILANITIGNGAIIGAGSVVTKDVPDYAVVCGNPARIIKYRFTENQIEILNQIKWWDWSDEKIRENIHFFRTNDMTEFFEWAKMFN